jgi:hypothetical protein
VQIKGIGSGFINQDTGLEDPEPMHIHITFVPAEYLVACFLTPYPAARTMAK